MRVWRVSSFSKIKPARPAALKHQAQTRQNRGGSAGLAGLAGTKFGRLVRIKGYSVVNMNEKNLFHYFSLQFLVYVKRKTSKIDT